MKKLLFLFSCSLLALSAGAQEIEPVKTTDGFGYTKVIAGKYTCDGKGRILIFDDDKSDELPKVKIFNEDLNEEKSFQFENSDDVVGYTLKSRRDTVYAERKRDNYAIENERVYGGFSSINDVKIDRIKIFVEDLFSEVRYSPSLYTYKEVARTSNTITFELGVDADSVKKVIYEYGYEGCAYVKGFIVCTFDEDSKSTTFKSTISRYTYGPTFTGDWKETKEKNGGFYRNNYICLYDCDVVDGNEKKNGYYITQNFFNKDVSYEYILPIL